MTELLNDDDPDTPISFPWCLLRAPAELIGMCLETRTHASRRLRAGDACTTS